MLCLFVGHMDADPGIQLCHGSASLASRLCVCWSVRMGHHDELFFQSKGRLFSETFVSQVPGKPFLKWKDVKSSFAYLKLLFGYTRHMKTLMRKLCDDLNIFLKRKNYRAILIAVHRTIGLVLLNAPAPVRRSARPIRACPWFDH